MRPRRIHVYSSALILLAVAAWLTDRQLRQHHSSLAEKMGEAKEWLASRTPEGEARRKSRQRWLDDRTAMLKKAKQWSDRLTAARPELQIQYREVADEKNGLLQLMEWAKSTDLDPRVDAEAYKLVGYDGHWDTAQAEALVAEHRDVLEKLEKIGLTPDASCKGVDRMLLGEKSREISGGMKLLTMQIRLTGERGDFATAEKTARALYGLARHLGNSEAPSSLDFVVAAGMRAQSGAMLQGRIAEAKTPEELDHWRALLPDDPPPAPADMLRGDWDAAAAAIYLPAILGDASQGFHDTEELTRAPEATGEAYANLVAAGIREAEPRTPQEFLDLQDAAFVPSYEASAQVPEKARKLIEETLKMQMRIYQSALMNQRSQTLRRAAAAVALGEEPPSDPLTGQSFLYDEKTRILSAPGEPTPQVEPVTVPLVKAGE